MWDEAREVGRHLGPVDPTPSGYRPEGEGILVRTWASILAHGLVWIGFGVAVLGWRELTLDTLAALIAACALVHGALSGTTAATVPFARAWAVLGAVMAIAVGVVLLVWPDISATSVLSVLGAWAIALGVLQMVEAHVLPFSGERATLLVWTGIVTVTFGIVMLIEARDGALANAALVAAFTLVTGVLQSAFAIDLRRLARGQSS
jgi:uncharacterized membrane protein HdeD (DUF308 family)